MGDPVQLLPLRVGRERLVKETVLVPLVVSLPQEVELVLAAPRSGRDARHDHVNVGDLAVVDPVHPGDLRAVVLRVAVPPVAVEEDVRSLAAFLSGERQGGAEQEREAREAETRLCGHRHRCGFGGGIVALVAPDTTRPEFVEACGASGAARAPSTADLHGRTVWRGVSRHDR